MKDKNKMNAGHPADGKANASPDKVLTAVDGYIDAGNTGSAGMYAENLDDYGESVNSNGIEMTGNKKHIR